MGVELMFILVGARADVQLWVKHATCRLALQLRIKSRPRTYTTIGAKVKIKYLYVTSHRKFYGNDAFMLDLMLVLLPASLPL